MSVEFDPFAGPAFEKSALTTESQREIFAAAQWGKEANCAYNESGSLRFAGALNAEALSRAFVVLGQRHESLRMFFAKDGQTLFVRPPGAMAVEWSLIDLTGSPETEREAQLSALLVQDVETPFDLENGPLFRATLVQLARDAFQLVMTGHHIVLDGWSWGVILKELGELYTAEASGMALAWAPAPSFVHHAVNERSTAQGSTSAQDLSYWLKQFAGSNLPELDLPTDRRRPAFKTYSSRRIDFPLQKGLTDQFKKAGAKLGASYFVSMLAALAATIHRLTRQDDLVIGIPAAGQAAAGEQSLVGHCVNLLPLRLSVRGGMSFAELLKAAQVVMLDGAEHQQLSYGALLKQLAIKRDPSRLPLISVVFNVDQALHGQELGFAGVDVRYLTNPRHFENFELFINAAETRGETVLEVQYNTDLFDHDSVTRWFASFQVLLESAATDPTRSIDSLDWMVQAERNQLLTGWNATRRDYSPDTTVHGLLEAQVDRTPDAVALQFNDTRLTYSELDCLSNQLARHLRELGVGPDRLVAIFTERNINMVVGMIAVLKAGGAYVPLDPNYPQDRVSFIRKDADASILLTQATLVDRLEDEDGIKVIAMDEGWSDIAKQSTDRLGQVAGPQHLSHVIYTSGSTGKPKGVAIEHRNTVNFCNWAGEAFTATQRDGVLFSTSICFDLSVFELFGTLAWGGRVVLVENALALASLPADANVRLVNSVPSVLATVLKSTELPVSVQTVNLAGEPLKDDLVSRLYSTPSVKDVFDLYGPSETTTYSTYTRRVAGARPTIGKPIANTFVYVLDARQQMLPQGLPGELFIGGEGVARGYLGRSDLTAERFLADPFSSQPGARMYRTGDLVRWLPDGTLEYLGRIDNQVKIRGFRIELGEIESVLSTHAMVREAAVTSREDVPGDVRIVAYVVPREADGSSEMVLRKHLRRSLPDYMVPQHFIELEKLPLTPNGKIDRKALPALLGAVVDARTIVAPRTDAERLLLEVVQESLKLSGVSINDNFFDLGGHSLLCFQVIGKIQEKTGVKLNPRLMLLNSLEQTAAILEQEISTAGSHSIVASARNAPEVEKSVGFAKKMLQKIGL